MRFADTPFMKRVFNLARCRGLEVKLIPYIMQMVEPTPNTFLYYHGHHAQNQAPSVTKDPFHVSSYLKDTKLATPQAVSQKVADVLQRFRNLFRVKPGEPLDIACAMSKLYREAGNFSMRSYMFEHEKMDPKDVNWCETLDKSTGWYDRALTEST
jgi:hypothetical protein